MAHCGFSGIVPNGAWLSAVGQTVLRLGCRRVQNRRVEPCRRAFRPRTTTYPITERTEGDDAPTCRYVHRREMTARPEVPPNDERRGVHRVARNAGSVSRSTALRSWPRRPAIARNTGRPYRR